MSNGMGNPKLPPGCQTPADPQERALYEQLARIYAPVVYFHPAERFFPVDLESYVRAAALYQTVQTPHGVEAAQIRDYRHIKNADLAAADASHFMTVAGWDILQVQLGGGPVHEVPAPRLDLIYETYRSRQIDATLTCYATVCKAGGVTNYHMVKSPEFQPAIGNVGEALLLNYYFFFPGAEPSAHPALALDELYREGDWSGITLLFLRQPDLNNLVETGPRLAVYYIKYEREFATGMAGFRAWKDVTRVMDVGINLATHPVVYISHGLHNCYYEPVDTAVGGDVPSGPASATGGSAEDGKYQPIPDSTVLAGGAGESAVGVPWWAYMLEPATLVLEICGQTCGVESDRSGVLGPAFADSAQGGGWSGFPAGSDSPPGAAPDSDKYPPGIAANAAGQVPPLTPRLEYVDLTDVGKQARWGFRGDWGAATMETLGTATRGWLLGFPRPTLGAWFFWNLYFDKIFGSGG